MATRIDPSRLRTIRQAKNLTLEALARKARVSKETIHRIEKGRPQHPRITTLQKLSTALEVADGVLTGSLPIPSFHTTERELARESTSQFNVELNRAQHNAFVLVAHRYDIPMARIAELAPFLFVLAAEQSLRWRKAKLDRLSENLGQQDALLSDFPHLPCSIAVRDEAADAVNEEERSISARDILADQLPDRIYENFPPVKWRYDETANNPFVRYLHHAASDYSEIVDIEYFSADDLTEFTVCKDDLAFLTDSNKELIDAVRFGIIQLNAMPRRLFGTDVTQDRLAWMRSQLEAFRRAIPDDVPSADSL